MKPGFWRISPDTVTLLECPLPIACVGGEPGDVVEATDDYAINGGAPRKAVPSPKPSNAPMKTGPTATPHTTKPNRVVTASIWQQISFSLSVADIASARRKELPMPLEVAELDHDDRGYDWEAEGDSGQLSPQIRRLLANPAAALLPAVMLSPPRRELQSTADSMTFGCGAAYMVRTAAEQLN